MIERRFSFADLLGKTRNGQNPLAPQALVFRHDARVDDGRHIPMSL
jgi:hypothetical protein